MQWHSDLVFKYPTSPTFSSPHIKMWPLESLGCLGLPWLKFKISFCKGSQAKRKKNCWILSEESNSLHNKSTDLRSWLHTHVKLWHFKSRKSHAMKAIKNNCTLLFHGQTSEHWTFYFSYLNSKQKRHRIWNC